MSEKEEANSLIGRIESMAGNLKDKPIDNVQLDLLECVAHLLTNITFQVAVNCAKTGPVPIDTSTKGLEPGEKCEVNFSPEGGPHSDYWQLATVLEKCASVDTPVMFEYRTTATTDWVHESRVRRPVEKK